MALEQISLHYTSRHTEIPLGNCEAALKLMVEEECTLPFVARYRKDRTGGLTEIELKKITDTYQQSLALEKRRHFILQAVEKKGVMTEELKRLLERAVSLTQLEDLYAPYKSKTQTKAEKAIAQGLAPLAELILTSKLAPAEFEKTAEAQSFFGADKEVKTFREALFGASDILIERFAHDAQIKDKVRRAVWREGRLISKKREKAETLKDFQKYQDFFDYSEEVHSLKNPKNGHRFLAMRRGAKHRVLKVELSQDLDFYGRLIQEKFFPELPTLGFKELLPSCVERAYQNYLWPSLDQEIKNDLKVAADEAAIHVFSINLQNLLLAPYLGSKAVMGVDPGVTSGCKVVVINQNGAFLGGTVIYPHGPKADPEAAVVLVNKILDVHPVDYVSIGSGTFGRETLEFFENKIDKVKEGAIKATLISEAGASVYSASELAQKEFPDIDVTIRGAISIARRFQDPLAELVKIDPKSIGVGQYQHDVNQTELEKTLGEVVEHCVNYVGVDLNTASAPLLSFVSGIGPKLSEQIVSHRDFIGGFKTREQLMDVPKFSQKTFEQAAGFLRLYQSKNPLDATFIHPEHYTTLGGWVTARGKTIHDLVNSKELVDQLENDSELMEKMGAMTLKDVAQSLKAPSQDPRTQFKSVEFDKNLKSMSDLKVGTWYNGVIANITMFGAFVDVGIKEKGLVHVSQLAPRWVRDSLEQIKVGQEIRVKVIEVDLERARISLSAITDEMLQSAPPRPPRNDRPRQDRGPRREEGPRGEGRQDGRQGGPSPRRHEERQEQGARPPRRDHAEARGPRAHAQNFRANEEKRARPEQSGQNERGTQERRPQNNQKSGRPHSSKELKQNPFAVLKNIKLEK